MPNLTNSLHIASAGMQAQSDRLKITAQNIANVDSTAQTPGGTPYQRKTISFKNFFNKQLGVDQLKADKILVDKNTPFDRKYDPANPAADTDGYVQMPNVNLMVEMMDMREAQRSYEANINVVEVTKRMLQHTIDVIR